MKYQEMRKQAIKREIEALFKLTVSIGFLLAMVWFSITAYCDALGY